MLGIWGRDNIGPQDVAGRPCWMFQLGTYGDTPSKSGVNCKQDLYYSRVSLNVRMDEGPQKSITDSFNKKGVTFARLMCLPNAPANPLMQCKSHVVLTEHAGDCATRDMYCCDGLCENDDCCTRARSERTNAIVSNNTLYNLTAMDALRKQRQTVMQKYWLRMFVISC